MTTATMTPASLRMQLMMSNRSEQNHFLLNIIDGINDDDDENSDPSFPDHRRRRGGVGRSSMPELRTTKQLQQQKGRYGGMRRCSWHKQEVCLVNATWDINKLKRSLLNRKLQALQERTIKEIMESSSSAAAAAATKAAASSSSRQDAAPAADDNENNVEEDTTAKTTATVTAAPASSRRRSSLIERDELAVLTSKLWSNDFAGTIDPKFHWAYLKGAEQQQQEPQHSQPSPQVA